MVSTEDKLVIFTNYDEFSESRKIKYKLESKNIIEVIRKLVQRL